MEEKGEFEGLSFFLEGRLKRKHSEISEDIIAKGGKIVKKKSQATHLITNKKVF
jgi:hypothetical protein